MITHELLMALMVQINAIDPALPVPNYYPTIVDVEQCTLQTIMVGNDRDYCAAPDPDGPRVTAAAVFMPGPFGFPGLMLIDRGIALETPFGQAMLVHELVHHMQDQAGMMGEEDPGCFVERVEAPAYKVQLEWLRREGFENPMEISGLDGLTLHLLTHCGERPYSSP